MRKVIFGLLLAGAAAPALAAGGPRWNNDNNDDNTPRQEARAQRPSRSNSDEARPSLDRSARPDRSVEMQRPQVDRAQMGGGFERPTQVERPQFDRSQFGGNYQRPDRPTQVERPQFDRSQFGGENRPDRAADVRRVRPVTRYNPYVAQDRNDAPDSVRNWRPRQEGTGYVGGYNRDGRTGYNRDGYLGRQVGSYVPRQGTQPPLRVDTRRTDEHRWNHDWRSDRRYDWRDYRRRHESLFHIGIYMDPFGWNYQRFSVGYRLWPNYYQQNYWIDPAMYGLPYAPPGMQWVRYWDDALLVDTFSGEVVDSIPNFFW